MARCYRRRRFIRIVGGVALTSWLAACGGESGSSGSGANRSGTNAPAAAAATGPAGAAVATVEPVEKAKLSIGYIPITCIAPLVMAAPLGFYKKYGLDVTLKKYAGPAPLRDGFLAGEVDASHLLLPMPMAMSLGIGSAKTAVRVAVSQNLNGQAITLANKHRGKVTGPRDLRGMVLGVPFDFSMHNLLLRHYLAQGGVNPDTEVQIRLVRAPDMVASLISGTIDGFLGPDPFNQRAVHEKAGYLFLLSKNLWDGHPCCAFAVKEEFRSQFPATYRAVTRALVDAAVWSNDPANREQIATVIAPEEYLNQPLAVVKAVLTGQYEDGTGQTRDEPERIGFNPFPYRSWGVWMATQLQRWDYAKNSEFATPADYKRVAEEGFLTADTRAAMQAIGLTPPANDSKLETILGKTFDPDDPMPWTAKVVA